MTDSRMWVPVSVAAKILKVSRETIYRMIKTEKLRARQPTKHTTQIERLSICQACSPSLQEHSLDCCNCVHLPA